MLYLQLHRCCVMLYPRDIVKLDVNDQFLCHLISSDYLVACDHRPVAPLASVFSSRANFEQLWIGLK